MTQIKPAVLIALCIFSLSTSTTLLAAAPSECYKAQYETDAAKRVGLFAICEEGDDLSEGALLLIHSRKGEAYTELKQYQKAVEEFTKAIFIDQENVPAMINRGVAYIALGNINFALIDFNSAIELDEGADPKLSSIMYNGRGDAYFQQSNFKLAIADYTKAAKIDAKNKSAFSNRGSCYNELGDSQAALKDYSKALSIDPKYITALLNRGAVYASLGRYQDAITDFKKILTLDPQNTNAQKALNSTMELQKVSTELK